MQIVGFPMGRLICKCAASSKKKKKTNNVDLAISKFQNSYLLKRPSTSYSVRRLHKDYVVKFNFTNVVQIKHVDSMTPGDCLSTE